MRRFYKPVAEFYDGQSAFITGGTGFIGKVLIEKLLYSCTGINKVYLLIRDSKKDTAHQRIQTIIEQPVFTRLRHEKPQALKKIVPIVGDISKPKLGLKPDDEKLLTEAVSIVFHVAATIRFNEPLDVAMNINVGGTEQILNLCQNMKNIKALVHVSTAFSNIERHKVDEVVYPPPTSINKIKEVIERGMKNDEVDALIKKKLNTYLFTKSIAENLVAENHGSVPTVIVRPSIVTSSISEPTNGWIEGWSAANYLTTMMALGWNRCLLTKRKNVVDFIPVDYVTNLMIVAAARCVSSSEVPVRNSTTSGTNPLTYNKFLNTLVNESRVRKHYHLYPYVICTRFETIKFLITLIFQIMPAYVADTFLFITGKKRKYAKIQNQLIMARNSTDCVISRTMCVTANKTVALAESLSPTDKEIFSFNPKAIDWEKYIRSYHNGLRKYLLKT